MNHIPVFLLIAAEVLLGLSLAVLLYPYFLRAAFSCAGLAVRAWHALTKPRDRQFQEAQRIARQASKDFKRRQRLRSVRFWNF
jgi:hypothetical protein